MESQGDQIIHEMLEAAAREMEFYKELKKRRLAMSIWKPKAELSPQQQLAFQQSNCDPVLRDVAKTVLEEIQYNRNERNMGKRIALYFMLFAIIVMVAIPTIIFYSVTKSGKSKHK